MTRAAPSVERLRTRAAFALFLAGMGAACVLARGAFALAQWVDGGGRAAE